MQACSQGMINNIPPVYWNPPVYCTDIMQGDDSI